MRNTDAVSICLAGAEGGPRDRMTDRHWGILTFALGIVGYLYYTAWVIGTPFVDPRVEWYHSLFPDKWFALAIPSAMLVVGFSAVLVFIAIVLSTGRTASDEFAHHHPD